MVFRKKKELEQCSPQEWKERWQSLVPPENREVPITLEGETVVAFVQINQFALMLQDGLLMEKEFFDVCSFFQRAGYHVIWLMRCTQDIYNGYLKRKETLQGGFRQKWLWKRPTTNFGRWTSDNQHSSILLQTEQLPEGSLQDCSEKLLQRVTWADSDDETKMVPGRTEFQTVENPSTPAELLRWLQGEALSKL